METGATRRSRRDAERLRHSDIRGIAPRADAAGHPVLASVDQHDGVTLFDLDEAFVIALLEVGRSMTEHLRVLERYGAGRRSIEVDEAAFALGVRTDFAWRMCRASVRVHVYVRWPFMFPGFLHFGFSSPTRVLTNY